MESLEVDDRGFPVPFFVAYIDGIPDHRVADPRKQVRALNEKLCWVCGQTLGNYLSFVIGPMCTINRITSEPPNHLECAQWAVRGCPFLSMPKMERRDADKPEGINPPAGIHLERNPGVMVIYTTKTFTIDQVENGILFSLGDPESVTWWREGRPAFREECTQSIDSGFPFLLELANQERSEAFRNQAIDDLINSREVALRLLPKQL